MSQDKISDIVNALFETEQFNNIEIAKDDGIYYLFARKTFPFHQSNLMVIKHSKSEDLLKGLEGAGISGGQVYKESTLEGMKSELVRQYASQGRYGARYLILTTDKPRNTIDLKIVIDEGKSAKIHKIRC